MKISIRTNTGLTFELSSDDAETVEAAVRAITRVITSDQRVSELRSVRRPSRAAVIGSMDNHPRPAGVFTGTQSLNAIQYETWKLLLNLEAEGGVHLSAVARALAITDGAAGSRCSTLVKRGFARRVREGYYQAIKQSVNTNPASADDRNSFPTPRDVAEACKKTVAEM